ncbi:MurR/RpiR family transcriptional regulator [Paraburkholderia strydomiana]|jgi:RpiR family carbohydrate utilization transcriptional regulator|uniref:MurR/RpiR family transcriptional regulator n=1 Tax=Paraburkholderia strydomiana TaxID=1245417 RepID=A0ABW9ERV6_9BURK
MRNDLLRGIAMERSQLVGPAERIADVVLGDPEAVIKMSMAELARASGTSDPTVVRFFRRFDCEDYQDFKVRLAQGLIPQAPFDYETITLADSPESLCAKVVTNSLHAIQRFASDVDSAAIDKAVSKLMEARGVFLFGLGISETIAFDAEHKLFRLGLRCRAVMEAQKQLLLVPTLRSDEVAVFFSHSGATKSLVEAASIARSKGAYTIAITAPGSRLTQACDLTIGVPAYENTELYTPLTARINHLLVVNMLVAMLGSRQGHELPDNLAALDPWLTNKFMD